MIDSFYDGWNKWMPNKDRFYRYLSTNLHIIFPFHFPFFYSSYWLIRTNLNNEIPTMKATRFP